MKKTPEPEVHTIVIDNFTGALTRNFKGPLNSGLATTDSYGYNPFISPKNLTWGPAPTDITAALNGLLLDGKTRVEGTSSYLYGITNTGHFVKINTSTDAITDLATLSTGTPTFNYGASLYLFNNKVWISNDKGLSRIDFDGTNETQVGTWDSSHFIQSTYHPLMEFQGLLLVGNTTDGTSTNFGTVDSTNLITTYSKSAPAFPVGTYVHDIDVFPDFSYVVFSVSSIPNLQIQPFQDLINSYTGDSYLFRWNGSDAGITSGLTLPNFGITSLNYFGENAFTFMYDFFGAALYDGSKKLITLAGYQSPLPNASTSTGNFIVWASNTGQNFITMYGSLDQESPTGYWQLARQRAPNGPASTGLVTNVPFMSFVGNQVYSIASGLHQNLVANKLYFAQQSVDSADTTFNRLYSVNIPNFFNSSITPSPTIYYSQKQIFEKKISVSQFRVYCSATIAGNSFFAYLQDQDDNIIGELDYTYTAGADITKLQGSLTRINQNVSSPPVDSLQLVIEGSNNATSNMKINKVEIDWSYAGK